MRRRYDGGKEIWDTDYINSRYSLGLSGVSGQYLMSRGVSVDMITSLRLLVSGFFLVGLAYATAKEQLLIVLKNRKALLGILFCDVGSGS